MSNCQDVENVELLTCRECQIIDALRISRKKTRKLKKVVGYHPENELSTFSTLDVLSNEFSIHQLTRHVDSTCQHQFTLSITNPGTELLYVVMLVLSRLVSLRFHRATFINHFRIIFALSYFIKLFLNFPKISIKVFILFKICLKFYTNLLTNFVPCLKFLKISRKNSDFSIKPKSNRAIEKSVARLL